MSRLKLYSFQIFPDVIYGLTEITYPVLADFTIKMKAGDSMYVEGGELILKSYVYLPGYYGGGNNWRIAVMADAGGSGGYVNVDSFKYSGSFTYDKKTQLYEFKFYSTTVEFFDYLKSTSVWDHDDEYDSMSDAIVVLDVTAPLIGSLSNRGAFNLAAWIDGFVMSPNYGITVNDVEHIVGTNSGGYKPLLFRAHDTAVDDYYIWEIVASTFGVSIESAYQSFSLRDLFDLIVFGWNCFVYLEPNYTLANGNTFSHTLKLIPRTNLADAASFIDPVFREFKYIPNSEQIDGVLLEASNFSLSLGNSTGRILERSYNNVHDPAGVIWEDTRDYNVYFLRETLSTTYTPSSGPNNGVQFDKYTAVTGSGDGWFGTGDLTEDHYDGVINDGHVIEGEMDWDPSITLFSQFQYNHFGIAGQDKTYQIIELNIKPNLTASFRAIMIEEV